MATTKKPSAKQIAARKKFVAAVRSGAFLKGAPKRKPAAKRAKNPAPRTRTAADSRSASSALKLRAAPKRKAPVRKRNPVDTMSRGPRSVPASGFAIFVADHEGKPTGMRLALLPTKPLALEVAKAMSDRRKRSLVIVGKK